MKNTPETHKSEIDIEKQIEKRIARRFAIITLIAVIAIFSFSLICFFTIHNLNRGSSPDSPLLQVRENDNWLTVRQPYLWDVETNVESYEFVHEDGSDDYDVILHYKARELK